MTTYTMRPRNTRKARVARLVYMLAKGEVVRTADLCARFHVSRRTFARYIADVRDAGFDVEYDEVEDTYRLNSADFSTAETGSATTLY